MYEYSFGFCIYGEDCLCGYRIIKKEKTNKSLQFLSLEYFLLCRAIEIFLKSYLIANGLQVAYLKKKYGHDITLLLDRAIELKLEKICGINRKDRRIILMLAPYYIDKEFEYMTEGMQHLPDLDTVEALAEKLHKNINEYAKRLMMEAYIKKN